MLDIQCLFHEPQGLLAGRLCRCQLGAGHEGPHAAMFCQDGRRMVRCWSVRGPQELIEDHPAGVEQLPWVPGMPSVAWSEPAEVARAS